MRGDNTTNQGDSGYVATDGWTSLSGCYRRETKSSEVRVSPAREVFTL